MKSYLKMNLPLLFIFLLLNVGCMPGQEPVFKTPGLPLVPHRSIEISTTEGTSMNMDLSPDGKTLVFDLLGNIFSLPLEGGAARQLTSGMAWDSRPVWSPDGKHIAFLSDRTGTSNIWTIGKDGESPIQVSWEADKIFQNNLEWLKDSMVISGNTMYPFPGVKEAAIQNDLLQGDIRISRDDSFAYYATNKVVWKYALENNTLDTLAIGQHEIESPVISPDGKWLVYVSGCKNFDTEGFNHLLAVDLKTGLERELVRNIGYSKTAWERMSFTPDSQHIILGYGGKIHKVAVSSGEDSIIPFSAEIHQEVGPFIHNEFPLTQDSLSVKFVRYADIHPKATSFLFTALSGIYEMDLSKGKPKELLSAPYGQFQASYSPDGKAISFVSWESTKGGNLWLKKEHQPLERLTAEPGVYQHPVWSPDGQKIAIVRGKEEAERYWWSKDMGSLLLIDEEKRIQKLLDEIPVKNRPAFNRTGDSIFVIGKGAFFGTPMPVIRINVKDQKRDTIAMAPAFASSIAYSPHKKILAYIRDYNLYIKSIEKDGGEEIQITQAGALDPRWEKDGRFLYWFTENNLNSLDIAKYLKRKKNRKPEIFPETKITEIPLKVPYAKNSGITALIGARAITMRGKEIIEKATILIKDDRILEVGSMEKVKIPAAAKIVDLSGKTVLPGFMDIHAHDGPPQDILVNDWERYRLNLAYGITTTMDPSSSMDIFGYKELLASGKMLGPRITGAVSMSNFINEINDLADARHLTKGQKAMGAEWLKFHDGGTRKQRQFLAIAAREEMMNITVHPDTENILGKNFNLALISDGFTGWEHLIENLNFYNDVEQLLKESKINYTPTLTSLSLKAVPAGVPVAKSIIWPDEVRDYYLQQPKLGHAPSVYFRARNAVAAAQLGANIRAGSHGNFPGLQYHHELWILAESGMETHELLMTATLESAKGLGYGKDLGSLEVGKIADLVIMDRNPLESIFNIISISAVMRNGEMYSQEELKKPRRHFVSSDAEMPAGTGRTGQ